MHNTRKKDFMLRIGRFLLHSAYSLLVILSSVWLCFALWIQQPGGLIVTRIIMLLWVLFSLSLLTIYFRNSRLSRRKNVLIYLVAFAISLVWYFNIPAKQDREWSPDVAQIFSYEKHGDLITIHNVRNFEWYSKDRFQERWETRNYDLNQISGVNIITSYWMGPQVAHTLVSFDFTNQKPLVFSIEIRKEKNESFSAIGGFFRQFELSLIAADEKDIVYTRSNIRGEQVYFFPVAMSKPAMKALFIEYLEKSDELRAQPKWYNTLSSNCTTLVFDMAQAIEGSILPKDYRLLASGYLPNYLYDLHVLNPAWNLKQWYQHAHVNPRTIQLNQQQDQSSERYSTLMREGLLKPVSIAETQP